MQLFLDIEVYRNYFLASFMNRDKKVKRFEIFNDDASNFDARAILNLLENEDIEHVTFNGNSYDIPVLTYALTNPDTRAIKEISNEIIEKGIRPWNFYRDEGLRAPDVNHIDLIEVAPGQVGLKLYGGRLGSKRLQELPIPHDATISREQIPLLRNYCRNDTIVTMNLYDALSGQVELRRAMSAKYGIDLRSKSDAQIAEAVLKAEYTRITGAAPSKPQKEVTSFYYDPPKYVRFRTEQLQNVLKTVCAAEMVVSEETGHVKMPKEIDALSIKIGGSSYKLGIGGLHSQESEQAHYSDNSNVLIDRDVESYYPRMMLNMNMQPGGFGEHFNTIFGNILEERLEAKHRAAELENRIKALEKELAKCEG